MVALQGTFLPLSVVCLSVNEQHNPIAENSKSMNLLIDLGVQHPQGFVSNLKWKGKYSLNY